MKVQHSQQLAKQFAQSIQHAGIAVDAMYLFGSQISGTAHDWSDLDICVISPHFGKDRISERVRLFTIAKDISDIIEPHPFSPSEFDDQYNSLAQQILHTGMKVVL